MSKTEDVEFKVYDRDSHKKIDLQNLIQITHVYFTALQYYAKHHHHMPGNAPNHAREALEKAKEIGWAFIQAETKDGGG